jgi:hypothetical protein
MMGVKVSGRTLPETPWRATALGVLRWLSGVGVEQDAEWLARNDWLPWGQRAPRKPGVSILPCVLECARAPRHMLPYGNEDRPIYSTTSRMRVKEGCDLVPVDFPGNGLWCKPFESTALWVQAAGCSSRGGAERRSFGL